MHVTGTRFIPLPVLHAFVIPYMWCEDAFTHVCRVPLCTSAQSLGGVHVQMHNWENRKITSAECEVSNGTNQQHMSSHTHVHVNIWERRYSRNSYVQSDIETKSAAYSVAYDHSRRVLLH